MGVPFYAGRLIRRYPRISTRLHRNEMQRHFARNQPVASLNLDMNSIIHTVASQVYLYGNHATTNPILLNRFRATSSAELERQHFEGVATAILDQVNLTRPQELLIVAIDGPAPIAKCYQQKQRRYKARSTTSNQVVDGYLTYSTSTTTSSASFDSNQITPGTTLMSKLDRFLEAWLRLNHSRLGVRRVIFSGSHVPGEGEHKIAHYLRTLSFTSPHAHVIYGLDSDLIFLSLISPQSNVLLLRDDVTSASEVVYYLFNIALLRTELLKEVRSLHDYLIMSCFCGNDFLPSSPIFTIGRGGLEAIVTTYQELGSPPLARGDRIHWANLRLLADRLASREPSLLQEQVTAPATYPLIPLQVATRQGVVSADDFRQAYYRRVLSVHGQADNLEGLERVSPLAEEWCACLAWIFRYYLQGMNGVNVEFVYHFTSVPLTRDIATALTGLRDETIPPFEWDAVERRGKELLPLEQLVSVLPPASSSLLPEGLRSLPDLVDLVPSTFRADLSGKSKEHEAVALLPFIDSARVRQAVQHVTLTAGQSSRNTFGTDVFLTRY